MTPYRHFAIVFFSSGKNSVDAFLESRPDFIDIGKAAIAALLARFENQDILFDYDNNWLRYLYNNLGTSFEKFGSNSIAFITFNYDRTVEHFFFESLKNSYAKSDDECRKEVDKTPIIHLHGRLGFLPWQSATRSRPYINHFIRDMLAIAAAEIKIVHEDIADGRDKDFERAKELLRKAEQILFLGFGYNSTNIKRLELEKLVAGRAKGTCVNLGEREMKNIHNTCNNSISLVPGDCFHFVREHLRWN
jgi:SIR2-like domain